VESFDSANRRNIQIGRRYIDLYTNLFFCDISNPKEVDEIFSAFIVVSNEANGYNKVAETQDEQKKGWRTFEYFGLVRQST
jgi:hypothetical protein